jgi:hypothetical protein
MSREQGLQHPQPTQMQASISGQRRAPSEAATQAFGKIGIPAVAAAAEMLRVKKPSEKAIHASFYLGSD